MEQRKITEEKAFAIILSNIEGAIDWADYVDDSEPDNYRFHVINALKEAQKEIKLIRNEKYPNKQEDVPDEI